MSTQSNLYTLPGVSDGTPVPLANQRTFEYQRRFSALTRGLSPSQIDKIFQNMQLFISTQCDAQGESRGAAVPGRPMAGKPTLATTLPRARSKLADLSKREHEVLVLVSNGYSRREIGEALEISVNTAARHISNIYRKLGVTSVAEASRYALEHSAGGQ